MAPTTRRAAAKAKDDVAESAAVIAALKLQEDANNHLPTKKRSSNGPSKTKKGTKADDSSAGLEQKTGASKESNVEKKTTAKRQRAPKPSRPKADVVVLPHGLGATLPTADDGGVKEGLKDDEAPSQLNGIDQGGIVASDALTVKEEQSDGALQKKKAIRKPAAKLKATEDRKTSAPSAKTPKARKAAKTVKEVDETASKGAKSSTDIEDGDDDFYLAKVLKPQNYGVKLGVSPWPDMVRPTEEECRKVHKLLVDEHGPRNRPAKLAGPSRTVAGCGEVECVLEAMIRTYISSNTTMENANKAIQGVLKAFPTIETGAAKGSVEWHNVRLRPRKDLQLALRPAGIEIKKSTHIKTILAMVQQENKQMREAAVRKKAGTADTSAAGDFATALPGGEKSEVEMQRMAAEILTTTPDVLTLDYLHGLPDQALLHKMTLYPGIGIKTAACVGLFCLQRDLFAIDTHVWRICKWLGWVPADASRDRAFAHLDLRTPNELKYALHQLMITHGQQCLRCRAASGEKTEGWEDAKCVLEELLTRSGSKKGGVDPPAKKKRKRAQSDGEDDVDEGRGPTKDEGNEGEDAGGSSPAKKLRVVKIKKIAVKGNGGPSGGAETAKPVRKRKAA